MAVLELERDVATEAPVRRPRRVGVLFIGSVAWIVLIGLSAIFAEWLPIQSPTDMDLLAKRAPLFSPGHILGTDHLGRRRSGARARRGRDGRCRGYGRG